MILLTGGTGFLGSNLLARLVGKHSVIVLKRSFSDTGRIKHLLKKVRTYDIDRVPVKEVFDANKIDLVIHCATNYGRSSVPFTEITGANLILPLHLIQESREHGVAAFINTDTILDKGVSAYSLSKSQFVDWMKQFAESLICIDMALEHFYGPFDDRSKFVAKIILDLLNRVERIELTPGRQKRDFIYIEDIVSAFERVIDFTRSAAKSFYRFEVGTAQTIEIRDFVQMAKTLAGNTTTHLDFGALPYRGNEVMESRVDISALLALGWKPQTPLQKGLKETIQLEEKALNEISHNRRLRVPGNKPLS